MHELYIIPDRSRIEESMQLAEEYGTYFEYNDFFMPGILDDEAKIRELVAFYSKLKRDRSKDTLHGAFLDVTIHSEDERIREVSELRVRQSVEIAVQLGIRGVIFHTNSIPNFRTSTYRNHWLKSNESFWRKILKEYEDIEILLENMFDEESELLYHLAEKMQDEKRFGVCLDYAHVVAFGKNEDITGWMKKLLPYTHHMHINDNDLKVDLHQALGEGMIDWSLFDSFLKEDGIDCSVLVEMREIEKQRASLEFMRKNGIYPFDLSHKSAHI